MLYRKIATSLLLITVLTSKNSQAIFGWSWDSNTHTGNVTVANGSVTHVNGAIHISPPYASSSGFYGQGISFATINGKQYIARGKNMSLINGHVYINNRKVNDSDIKTIKQTGKIFTTLINPEVDSVNIPAPIARVHLDPAHTGEIVCDEGVRDIFKFSNKNGHLDFDMPEGVYRSEFAQAPCTILARLSTKKALTAKGYSDITLSNSEVQKVSSAEYSRIQAFHNRLALNSEMKATDYSNIEFNHSGKAIDTLKIKADEYSKIRAKNIFASTINSTLSDYSTLEIDGSSNTHQTNTSGYSTLKAESLKTETIDARVSEYASALFNATSKITGKASDYSKVRYSGNPENFMKKSGYASVKRS